MNNTNEKFKTGQGLRLSARGAVGFAALLAGFGVLAMNQAQLASAQDVAHETFTSAEEASRALLAAVQSNNQQAIVRILGDEGLVSSDDELQDKRDRDRFAQKYQELHRLVREPDGTTFLYIGAENWPFPVPLVSRAGRWYFDSDAGAQEVLFRRIGEDESIAIETCHALVSTTGNQQNEANTDSAITQYARRLVTAQPANGGATSANGDDTASPFHGYYFRKLEGPDKAGTVSNSTTGGVVFIAYPAEYRSSGVMTFVVANGTVYEKDLGPNTEMLAKSMTSWKPQSVDNAGGWLTCRGPGD